MIQENYKEIETEWLNGEPRNYISMKNRE